MEDIRFQADDGTELFARSWRPPHARAVLIVCHGLKSHAGRYDRVAAALGADGFAVYAADMRGHGNSGGDPYWFDSFDQLLADLSTFVALVRAREPALPLFVLGHSAGGALATAWVARHPEGVAGLVSESFAHEVPAPALLQALLKGVAAIAPRLKVLDLPNAHFSRDPDVVASMAADPLIHQQPGPARVVVELLRNAADFKTRWAAMTTPVLILHGTADKATSPSGSQHFHDGVGSPDKTLKLYDGAAHDLFADTIAADVLADVRRWLLDHLPA